MPGGCFDHSHQMLVVRTISKKSNEGFKKPSSSIIRVIGPGGHPSQYTICHQCPVRMAEVESCIVVMLLVVAVAMNLAVGEHGGIESKMKR